MLENAFFTKDADNTNTYHPTTYARGPWDPNSLAESYNIYRDDEFIGNIPANTPYYLDDGTFGDETGFGLGFDIEYC